MPWGISRVVTPPTPPGPRNTYQYRRSPFAVSNRLSLRVSNGNNKSVVSTVQTVMNSLLRRPRAVPFRRQNHLGQSQPVYLYLLSPAGRAHVTDIIRQRSKMYSAGVSPLKDPVKDYPGYTGMQKGLFGSVQLLVFRGPLASVTAMVSAPGIFFFLVTRGIPSEDPPRCVSVFPLMHRVFFFSTYFFPAIFFSSHSLFFFSYVLAYDVVMLDFWDIPIFFTFFFNPSSYLPSG